MTKQSQVYVLCKTIFSRSERGYLFTTVNRNEEVGILSLKRKKCSRNSFLVA